MQSNEPLSREAEADYAIGPIEDERRPASAGRRVLATVAAWLVPGGGHLVLGRFGRAALFFAVILGSFLFGLAIEGRLYWPAEADPPSALYFDLISVIFFAAQIGSGLLYIASFLLGFGTTPNPQAPTYEYGNTFILLAGLLNYLIVYDAFDIAAGRKR